MDINNKLKKEINMDSIKEAAAKINKEKRGAAYLKVSNIKDKLELNRLLQADNISEFEEMFKEIE